MKKPKVLLDTVTGDDDGTLDRISELPDPLLVKILSLLPTKDAFTTCVISKRWQYLWTCIHDINFIYSSIYSLDENIVSFVNFIFAQSTASKLRKFHLKVSNKCWYDLHIRKWITYVFEKNVENIILESNFMIMYKLPRNFCTCSSLISLDLTRCEFDKGVVISWKSLKTVKFNHAELDDEASRRISLVSAELTFGIKCDIWADFEEGKDYKCRDYHCISQTVVENYLQKLSHVTKPTIGSWFVEVLFKLQLDRVPLPELRCKCLTLKLQLTKYNLSGVASLLQAFAHVETLNIDMQVDDHRFHCRYEFSYMHKEDNIDFESWISNFAFPSFKSINIICSFAICMEELRHKLFKLSQLLLKNAVVLEKFLIIAKRRKCRHCSEKCVSPYLSQLAAKLAGCGRSSTKFVMVFHELDSDD